MRVDGLTPILYLRVTVKSNIFSWCISVMNISPKTIEALLRFTPRPGYEIWELGFSGCWFLDREFMQKQSRYKKRSGDQAEVRSDD